jgi:peptidyl-prolyl cis-trans isomerase B (cyclophilin B)
MIIRFRKLTLDEVVYWGVLILAVTSCWYILTTLIHASETETTSFASQETYIRKQARNVVVDTSMGSFRITLLRSQTPVTINNFMALIQAGFYDRTKIHRVVPGLLIQGGDPLSREDDVTLYGTGGPGYVFEDEIRGIPMEKGVVAMANLGRPKTNGSQFFVLLADTAPAMQDKYTIFGKVVEGMDVVERMGKVALSDKQVPLEPIIVRAVRIE